MLCWAIDALRHLECDTALRLVGETPIRRLAVPLGAAAGATAWQLPDELPQQAHWWCSHLAAHGVAAGTLVVRLPLAASAQALHDCWQSAELLRVDSLVVQLDDAQPPDWPHAHTVLADWATAAAAHRLQLTLHVPDALLPNARAMFHAMQALQAQAVRLCFDTGGYRYCNPGANGEVALQRVLGWVAALVLRDVEPVDNWGPSLARPFPPLGQGGEVDFAFIRQLARSVEFSGPAIVAFDPPPQRGTAHQEAVRRELQHAVRLLEWCGWLDA
jgi:hypothetical protein